jgi:hypothetical protein
MTDTNFPRRFLSVRSNDPFISLPQGPAGLSKPIFYVAIFARLAITLLPMR